MLCRDIGCEKPEAGFINEFNEKKLKTRFQSRKKNEIQEKKKENKLSTNKKRKTKEKKREQKEK